MKLGLYLKLKNKPYQLEFENSQNNNDTNSVAKIKNKRYFIYSFSKPIFFRKGKFCVFSYSIISNQNSKDYKQIAFYKKVKGKWIEYIEIYNNLY